MEYARLCHSLDLIDQVDLAQADSISIPKVVEKLEHSNICIVRKGQHDQVSDGRDRIWVNSITGMPRRCGGQGDVRCFCACSYTRRCMVFMSRCTTSGISRMYRGLSSLELQKCRIIHCRCSNRRICAHSIEVRTLLSG